MSSSRHGLTVIRRVIESDFNAVNTKWMVGAYKHQLPMIQSDAPDLERLVRMNDYVFQPWPKHGLLRHDQLYEKKKLVEEARRRMTHDQQQTRIYRLLRANLLQQRKDILPKSEWTPMDAEHCYLNDIFNDIENEEHEKNLVKCANRDYDNYMDKVKLLPFRIWYHKEVLYMRRLMLTNMAFRKIV